MADHQLSESNVNNSNDSTNIVNNVQTDNATTEVKSDIQENNDEILSLKTELKKYEQKTKEQNLVQSAMLLELQVCKTEQIKLKQLYKNAVLEVQSLKRRNTELENEASNYQSALGVATNINMSDDDVNHNVRLHEDILLLQDKINDYVTNLRKSDVDIKIDEIAKLLPRYECQTKIDPHNVDKQFIKAILQRHALEIIFEYAEDFFSNNEEDDYLESVVVKKMDELYRLMEKFSSSRGGTDEVTKVTPIKLRQLIYAALGVRGLGDSDNNNFITEKFSENLNKSMNQYRVITSPKKKESTDELAKILIQDVFRILYFRLKIQEPIAQHHWFKCGDKISKTSMEESWHEEDIDELVVELCTFPLIYQGINSNQEVFTPTKVFTPAKVFTRHVPQSSILQNENVGTSLHNSITDNSDQTEQPINDDTVNSTTSDDSSGYETGREENEESVGTNATNTVETF